ncbi:MAG TPA: PmoA family protein [Streptomyces sp.]|nr:PmoA family protein [Streptomyces sp.]
MVNSALILRCSRRPVGRYVFHPEIRGRLAPRPYLHPVTTLGGVPVTEELPGGRLHHPGVGVAVPDVAGHDFWGGPACVREPGATDLDDRGVQRHQGWKLCDPDGFVEELSWRAAGRELLREHRTVAATELDACAWALDFTLSLTNTTDRELSIGNPAADSLPGAGYGGFFWRTPEQAAPPLAFTATGQGEDTVHGRTADWLGLAGDGWTLVFAGATAATRRDPWFVRAAEHPGVGSALAWADRLPVPAGGTVVRRIITVVADGLLDCGTAAAYVRKAVTA